MTRPYNATVINDATTVADERIETFLHRAEKLTTDPDQHERQDALLCRWCYYLERGAAAAGRAITPYECARCHTVAKHPTTNVPYLCDSCAAATGLCKHCCGHREGDLLDEVP